MFDFRFRHLVGQNCQWAGQTTTICRSIIRVEVRTSHETDDQFCLLERGTDALLQTALKEHDGQ